MRGNHPESEKEHGKLLIEGGEADIWGWGTLAGKKRVRRRVEWFGSFLGEERKNILECGCGTGLFTRQMAYLPVNITAVDISQALLEKARQECLASNVQFMEDNLEYCLHLPDNTFDFLYGVSVLHHLNVSQSLAVLRPKLRPNAAFAFSEPNILNPINRYYMFTTDLEKRRARGISPSEMAFTPQELRKLFEDAGYIVDSVMMRDFLHPAVPSFAISFVDFCGKVAEKCPLIQLWSGSIWICGRVTA